MGERPPAVGPVNGLTGATSGHVRFGAFEVDLGSGELRKSGVKIKLHSQPFELLTMLLERPGEVVTREELQQKLWPSETFVDFEHGLNKAVNKLREALSDDASNPRYIETLPRRGYRFISPVEQLSSAGLFASHRGLFALLLATALVLALVAGRFWYRSRQKMVLPATAPSIAVLPFADLSPSHDQEYLSDGLAEEILNDLTTIPNLRVVARTSAFQFKGKNEDLRTIGRKLGVDNILEGSVRKEGTRVRISAQLVKANDGFHLWAQSYDRDLKDTLGVQDDIAKAVTAALQVRLLPSNSFVSASASRTTNADAYQDYLQARYFSSMNNRDSLYKGLRYINEAIEFDSSSAPAYAWRSYIRQIQWDLVLGINDPEAMEKARLDAELAIKLDPNSADGYRMVSWHQAYYELNCPAAERTLNKAMELAPGDAWNLETKGILAMCSGRQEEAVQFLHQAIARDPLPVLPHLHLALNLRDLGRYEEAHAELRRALDLDPSSVWIHETRGEVFLAEGHPNEALKEMEVEPGWPFRELGSALVHHALGHDDQSHTFLVHLISEGANCCAYQIGEVYAYLGNSDEAFRWLNRAYKQHDGGFGYFKTDLLLKSIRRDPRYAELLHRLNLIQ